MEPMHKINKVEVRNLQIEDYIQLSQAEFNLQMQQNSD